MIFHDRGNPVLLIYRPLGYESVYLQLYKVADTPFHFNPLEIMGSGKVGENLSY